ncbi:MAG: hypothetical protein ACRCZF_06060, partial [Gemmataceae bacterium]
FQHAPKVINSAGLSLLRDGRGADRGFRQFDEGQYEYPHEVLMGCGAAILIPSNAPLFHDADFMYYEDLKLGWLWQKQPNRTVSIAPRSLVRHVHGGASGGGDVSPRMRYYIERNRVLAALEQGDFVLVGYCILVLLVKLLWLITGALRDSSKQQYAVATALAFLDVLWMGPIRLWNRWDRGSS